MLNSSTIALNRKLTMFKIILYVFLPFLWHPGTSNKLNINLKCTMTCFSYVVGSLRLHRLLRSVGGDLNECKAAVTTETLSFAVNCEAGTAYENRTGHLAG